MATIRYGDEDVPLLERPWRRDPVERPYPGLGRLLVGEHWSKAPPTDSLEHMPIVDGEPLLAGVALARQIMAEGADWACASEAYSDVFLDPDGCRLAFEGPLAELVTRLADADGSRGGMPDAMGMRGDAVILREAKRKGNDRLRPNQHEFVRRARSLLGDDLDVAVVEWDAPAAPRGSPS